MVARHSTRKRNHCMKTSLDHDLGHGSSESWTTIWHWAFGIVNRCTLSENLTFKRFSNCSPVHVQATSTRHSASPQQMWVNYFVDYFVDQCSQNNNCLRCQHRNSSSRNSSRILLLLDVLLLLHRWQVGNLLCRNRRKL